MKRFILVQLLFISSLLGYAQNSKILQGEELSIAVAQMLYSPIPPRSSVLTTEDDYALLVNYLCNGLEECSEGISLSLYNLFLFYPQKLEETVKRIDALPEDKRKKVGKRLCLYIFGHYGVYYRWDIDGFFARFPLLEKKYKDIIQSIYEANAFENQIVSYSEEELNKLSIELNRILNRYATLSETQMSDIILKSLKSEAPFYFDKQYCELIHYWLSSYTKYSTEIDTRVYQILYCQPYTAERLCTYINCLSEASRKIATNRLVETIVSGYLKDNGIFEERTFFLKFPAMKQYSNKVLSIVQPNK